MAIALIQYVNPIALTQLKRKYYIVYDLWLAFEMVVVYFLFIETKGSSLEEFSFKLYRMGMQDRLAGGSWRRR